MGGSWGQVTGGSGTHVLMLSLDLARGRARIRVAARRSIPFFTPEFRRLMMVFTCSLFTCRPPLPLGLPHQQRALDVQIARSDKETVDEETLGGVGVGGSWGQATGGGGTHVLMC